MAAWWAAAGSGALHRIDEIAEEIVGHFLGGAVDQALAELRKLAADLRLDVVGQQRAAVLGRKLHRGAALGKAGDAALALAGNLVAVRRIDIGQRDAAFEFRLHRPNLDGGDGLETGVGGFLQRLATGDASFQHRRIVELFPHRLLRRRKLILAVHRHGHVNLLLALAPPTPRAAAAGYWRGLRGGCYKCASTGEEIAMPDIKVDDGCSIHVEVEGPEHAPVLMLSNSLGTDLHMWDEQVAPLTQAFRLVRYDRRGHGKSD